MSGFTFYLQVLDIELKVFKEGGNMDLDIPEPPSSIIMPTKPDRYVYTTIDR